MSTIAFIYGVFLSAKLGFLTCSITDTQGQIILHYGGCPVHCKLFSSIPGLHTLDVNSSFPLVTTRKPPYIVKCPLGGKWPWLRTTLLRSLLVYSFMKAGALVMPHCALPGALCIPGP